MEDLRVKKKKTKIREEDADRISKLPDDLIHHIMSFMDTLFAVQTSILSKRWKLVWTTLPFLVFNGYLKVEFHKKLNYSKFFKKFISKRNHQSPILKMDIDSSYGLDLRLIKKYVKSATSHNVERLTIKSRPYCALSTFSSNSLKELTLWMRFKDCKVMESDHWTLPNLTTLCLADNNFYITREFPQSCFICLPALTTLILGGCVLPEYFSLPALKTLYLGFCTLPKNVWDFPALLNLELLSVVLPKNMSEYFLALASLQNLSINFGKEDIGCCVISSSQLVNLKINAPLYSAKASVWKIKVLAPRLCNFSAIGFFRITFEGSVLKNVNIKFWDYTKYKRREPSWVLKKHQDLFEIMFTELGSTKILTLDFVTLQALSGITDILVRLCSPFSNLQYLKLPHGCKESDISSSVRQYLLGGSPQATIVETCGMSEFQGGAVRSTVTNCASATDDVIPQMAPAVPNITFRGWCLKNPR